MTMSIQSCPSPRAILYYEDVVVGAQVTPLKKVPTTIQIFRYSAVTWNAHRIHFETEYARKEGHPDILVQAHLHGAFLLQMLMDWIGPQGRVLSFGWSNRGRAIPGDELLCRGIVTESRIENDRFLVDIEISEVNQSDAVCSIGKATVSLPSRGRAK
jgi:hydroxyacyl-ACP dehydratase HTD2-like protein with hotdog domain